MLLLRNGRIIGQSGFAGIATSSTQSVSRNCHVRAWDARIPGNSRWQGFRFSCRPRTRVRLDERQGAALSETLRDLANLVAAVLVLGQFVGESPLSWALVVLGFATWAGFVWFGLALVGGKRR